MISRFWKISPFFIYHSGMFSVFVIFYKIFVEKNATLCFQILSVFFQLRSYFCSFYKRDALVTGCLYCLKELTVGQVWVACLTSTSLVSKSKQGAGKSHVARSYLRTKFLKTISVLMKALSHKSVPLIFNFSIVS